MPTNVGALSMTRFRWMRASRPGGPFGSGGRGRRGPMSCLGLGGPVGERALAGLPDPGTRSGHANIRRARSRTRTGGYAATCPATSTWTPGATPSCRRSSSATISRRGSASASSPRSKHYSRSLAKTCRSASLNPLRFARESACCEAVRRPGMRFVPIKSEGQQALLMLHRVREQLLKQRTATINALRAHLAEFGIVAAQRRTGLRELLAVVADVEDRRLPPLARELLQGLVEHLRGLEERTAELDRHLVATARDGGACERLAAVPGVGPVIAPVLAARGGGEG